VNLRTLNAAEVDEGNKARTEVKKATDRPVWNEKFEVQKRERVEE
jgi:hypothetical protein